MQTDENKYLTEDYVRERVDQAIEEGKLPLKGLALQMEVEQVTRYTPHVVAVNSLRVHRQASQLQTWGARYKNPHGHAIGIEDVGLTTIKYVEIPAAFASAVSTPKVLTATVETHECPNCGADGHVTCQRCNGHGQLRCSCGDGKKTCGSCSGTGHILRTKYANGSSYKVQEHCSRCHGGGRVICSTCNGTTQVRCNGCKGSGQVVCGTCSGQQYFQKYWSFTDSFTPEERWQCFGEVGDFHPGPATKEIAHDQRMSVRLLEHDEFTEGTKMDPVDSLYDDYVRRQFTDLDMRSADTMEIRDHIRFDAVANHFDYVEVKFEYKDRMFFLVMDVLSSRVWFDQEAELRRLHEAEARGIKKLQSKSIFYPLQKRQLQAFNHTLLQVATFAIWMDGKIEDRERALFDSLLKAADLAESQRSSLQKGLTDNLVTAESLKLSLKEFFEKELAAIIVWMVAAVDGDVDVSEEEKFRQVVEMLGIRESRMPHIKKIATRELRYFEKGQLSIARIRLEGKRDTSLTIVPGSEDAPLRTRRFATAAIAFLGLITVLAYPRALAFGESTTDRLKDIEGALTRGDLARAVQLEKQVSGIKDNVLYDLPRRSAVARNILEKAVEKGDLATAAQYLQQLQTQHMLNTLLVEYPSLRLAVQKVRASQNIGGTPQ